ncbi:uncharacterized protein LOC108484404 isoform X2 [Gossypium arboreum]|uniref:uncharacterized protein LOC108484404 isoform X2 n=1 Tax=Gossypium arboreum TaxID=29729 RepID=UPI0008190D4B|nr:uncharacterized protein LOC108484404 isoform X2 [Gossypium arboreum]
MRFHLCLQRNNLKANGMMKILMTLISRNHGRMKMNLLRLQYNGLHCNLLVEEADYKSTTELFSKKGDDKTLDNYIPKFESDFVEYAEHISTKLRPYEKSYHYIALIKAVMRLSLTSLEAADVKETKRIEDQGEYGK